MADGIICGLGTEGYTLALKASIKLLKNENWQKINQRISKLFRWI